MADELMTRCEIKRHYKTDGVKEWRWVEVAVADVPMETESPLRCTHCHGAIKIQKPKVATAPHEHAKHKMRVDADNCQNGRAASLSSKPIE